MGETDAASVACGDILGEGVASESSSELVLGLQSGTLARNIGVAVLSGEGERTTVTLYLLDAGVPDTKLAVAAETQTIEIAGIATDAWTFRPGSLKIPAGTAISWVNNSDVAHTITGDDLAFDDSGLIEPSQSFSQTFAEPGTYHYRCAPHPWMEGVIVVE